MLSHPRYKRGRVRGAPHRTQRRILPQQNQQTKNIIEELCEHAALLNVEKILEEIYQ